MPDRTRLENWAWWLTIIGGWLCRLLILVTVLISSLWLANISQGRSGGTTNFGYVIALFVILPIAAAPVGLCCLAAWYLARRALHNRTTPAMLQSRRHAFHSPLWTVVCYLICGAIVALLDG